MTNTNESEQSKAREFHASKGWFNILERGLTLKMSTGGMTFADLDAGEDFPEVIKKIIEKGYPPEQVFNANKSALIRGLGRGWERQKRHLLIRKRNEHQDLSQGGIR